MEIYARMPNPTAKSITTVTPIIISRSDDFTFESGPNGTVVLWCKTFSVIIIFSYYKYDFSVNSIFDYDLTYCQVYWLRRTYFNFLQALVRFINSGFFPILGLSPITGIFVRPSIQWRAVIAQQTKKFGVFFFHSNASAPFVFFAFKFTFFKRLIFILVTRNKFD